jgi:hypothetical protein
MDPEIDPLKRTVHGKLLLVRFLAVRIGDSNSSLQTTAEFPLML